MKKKQAKLRRLLGGVNVFLTQYRWDAHKLLTPEWRKRVGLFDSPYKGHCYVTAEALYHLAAKGLGYFPHVLRMDKNTTHWYLQNAEGNILDPTVDQFNSWPKYEYGRGSGFLTKKPSKRAKILMTWLRSHVR
jgi:hypothetical protein